VFVKTLPQNLAPWQHLKALSNKIIILIRLANVQGLLLQQTSFVCLRATVHEMFPINKTY
jgi:hypothetical protein